MAAPTTAAIPPDRDLSGGYIVEVVALDASTGAVLTGLVVTDAVMVVENVAGTDLGAVITDVPPKWVPVPSNLFASGEG